ncbi:MAG: serine/threonine protein kinase [Polyangiaceae bacterium]|jgi:serine/threonine-protein kinase|nr:serine/threonine protein kinase [Polyangiaceae bacterium]
MGRVYAAEHVLMRKRLAIKVLHRELTTMAEVVARFEREAMAAANIEHPNVAAATDFGKLADGAVFLVLEYVQGKSLRDEVAAGPIAPERALHIARQIAAGLGSAHALDIVHRDLKPENVMLVEKGGDPDFVKVLDFGIAKVPIGEVPGGTDTPAHTPITKAGMVFGTPEYMAPEQALGQTVDGRADLYALGVILYEMLSGSRPFSSQSQVGILGQQLSKPPPKISDRAPGILVPPAVEAVAMRLLQRESGDRYQSAAEVVDVINRLLAPIPGRGIYRFTLPEGFPSQPPPSDEVLSLREAITVNTAPKRLDPTPVPLAGSLPELDPLLGASPKPSLDERLAALRAKLPPALQNAAKNVPSRLLFGGAAAVVLLLLLIVVVAGSSGGDAETGPTAATTGSPATSADAPPTPAKEGPFARPDELTEAKAGGPKAYDALLDKYPKDPNIAVEMARDLAAKKNYPGAVAAVGRALSIDSSFQNNAQLASLVFQTAQVKASSDAAFALLEGAMGSRGADIAYDLVTTPNVRPWVQSRAETFLQAPAFEKVATPGLRATIKLRYSAGCDEKRALLGEVKKSSDERALFELVPLQDKTGCGARKKDDCYPCLRTSNELDDAIAAVRTRKR